MGEIAALKASLKNSKAEKAQLAKGCKEAQEKCAGLEEDSRRYRAIKFQLEKRAERRKLRKKLKRLDQQEVTDEEVLAAMRTADDNNRPDQSIPFPNHTLRSAKLLLQKSNVIHRLLQVRISIDESTLEDFKNQISIPTWRVHLEIPCDLRDIGFQSLEDVSFSEDIAFEKRDYIREFHVIVYELSSEPRLFWVHPENESDDCDDFFGLEVHQLRELIDHRQIVGDPFGEVMMMASTGDLIASSAEDIKKGVNSYADRFVESDELTKYDRELMRLLGAMGLLPDELGRANSLERQYRFPLLSNYCRKELRSHPRIQPLFEKGLHVEEIVKRTEFKDLMKLTIDGDDHRVMIHDVCGKMVDQVYTRSGIDVRTRQELVLAHIIEVGNLLEVITDLKFSSLADQQKEVSPIVATTFLGVKTIDQGAWTSWEETAKSIHELLESHEGRVGEVNELLLSEAESHLREAAHMKKYIKRLVGLAYLAGDERGKLEMEVEVGDAIKLGESFKKQWSPKDKEDGYKHTRFLREWIRCCYEETGKFLPHQKFIKYMEGESQAGKCADYLKYKECIANRNCYNRQRKEVQKNIKEEGEEM